MTSRSKWNRIIQIVEYQWVPLNILFVKHVFPLATAINDMNDIAAERNEALMYCTSCAISSITKSSTNHIDWKNLELYYRKRWKLCNLGTTQHSKVWKSIQWLMILYIRLFVTYRYDCEMWTFQHYDKSQLAVSRIVRYKVACQG